MKIQRIITWSKLMALPLLLVACTESTELDNIEQTSEEVYPELDFSCESLLSLPLSQAPKSECS